MSHTHADETRATHDQRVRVRFWYDVVCPYAYLASTQVERLAQELAQALAQAEGGVEIEWAPMLLGGIFREIGAPQVPAAQMSPAKARMNTLELYRWAGRWGEPFSFSPRHPQRTVEAMRLLCVTPPHLRPRVSALLFARYWAQGAPLDERALLDATALAGLEGRPWESAEAKEALFERTREAASLGVFGAPTFEVRRGGGEEAVELFWGQDRLPFVREALGLPRAPSALGGTAGAEGAEVVMYHDVASPFSYLASTQAARVVGELGARLTLRPILLGGLFRAIGAPNVPLFEMTPPKRRYVGQDLTRWARWWGVPLRFPDAFPLRSTLAQRVLVVEPRATAPLYEAAWARGLNIGDEAVVRAALEGAGLDAPALMAAAGEEGVKAQLRAHTEEAVARGVFGVPTFEVRCPGAPPALYWGQDRLELVAEHLARGEGFAPEERRL